MYKYLFGPVPSRRLGMSLGVDLVPKKVCTLDCVYCEVGKTNRLTLERKEYILFERVKEELTDYFKNYPDPDYFTFSGSGEPTLNSRMADILNFIKTQKPDIPVAVLTNGTLLSNPEVRDVLKKADLVLPSVDAATEPVFQKINRPAEGLTAEMCIQGTETFVKEFTGTVWLEIFILPGYNDSPEELEALKQAVLRIQPDSVQLNTLDRPGTEDGLRPASAEELQKIIDAWDLDNVKIIAAAAKRKSQPAYRDNAADAIIETISRRPCTLNDMSNILGMHVNELNKYLDVLEAEGKITTQRQARGVFYRLAN